MAVPKTTETRYRDGSVLARHVIQRLQVTPSLHHLLYHSASCATRLLGRAISEAKRNASKLLLDGDWLDFFSPLKGLA